MSEDAKPFLVIGYGNPGRLDDGLGPAPADALAQDLFGAYARGHVVGVRGNCFDKFGEWLSRRARADLGAARRPLESLLLGEGLRSSATGGVGCGERRPIPCRERRVYHASGTQNPGG